MSKTHEPMLADYINNISLDRSVDSFSRNMCGIAIKEIREAQRFVMGHEVREAVRNLLTQRPTAILEAMQWCKPPFEKVWLEWPTPNQPEPKHAIRAKTTRVGALVTTVGPKAFRFFTAWSYKPDRSPEKWEQLTGMTGLTEVLREANIPNVGVSSLEVGVDIDALTQEHWTFKDWSRPKPMPLDTEYLQKIRDDVHNSVRWAIKDMKEREALAIIERAINWRLRLDPASQEMATVSESFGEAGKEAAMDDIKDEIGPVIAMLIMMNARNCVNINKVADLSRLNKARVKNKKPEYIEYKIVNIRFSAGQERAANAQGMSYEERKRHIVRGHFKTRRTGVFWWPAHLRGSAIKGYVEHRAYVMDHPPTDGRKGSL